MLTRVSFATDVDALFAHVEAAWLTARGTRPYPRRSDLQPRALGPALPYVSLLDRVSGDPIDFRYRLLGQHIISNVGENQTGRLSLSMPEAAPGRPVYASYVECVTTGRAVRRTAEVKNANGTKRRLHWALWPLTEVGPEPDSLLGAALFLDDPQN